jgi:hypothetical protein
MSWDEVKEGDPVNFPIDKTPVFESLKLCRYLRKIRTSLT